ncbi:MAG: penicillin-binding protein activator [Patescibacteria group bacterium]
MNKKVLGGILAVIIIIVVILIATNKKAATGNVVIGGDFLMSGPFGLIGSIQKNASEMAVDEINASGGINGRKLELVIEDNASDGKKAVDAYKALTAKGIKLIMTDSSPAAAAVRPAVIADNNFLMVPGATAPSYFDGSPLTCRIALTAKNFGPAYADLVVKRGFKTAVALLPDNEYGKGLATELETSFAAKGLSPLTIEFYNASLTGGDFRTNITKLVQKQKDVDVMIVTNPANTVLPMFKQISELGWKKPIVSDYYTIQNPAVTDLSVVNGIDYIDYEYSRGANPKESSVATEFKQKYAAKFGAAPVYLGAAHYDAIKLIAEAVSKVGDDPKKVGDYISSLKDYKGVTGTLSFNSDCEVSRETIFRTVKDAQILDL